ncbi:MAG TPA: hypothetical protein VK781_08770 [Solirubrobacteraceae bacterium]|nr:hypothetical protein [Solirubrobacteraceae bacterium]
MLYCRRRLCVDDGFVLLLCGWLSGQFFFQEGMGLMRPRSIGLVTMALLCSVGATVPVTVGADAVTGPEATFSAVPGLPDGRVYEQVSPTDKNGNSAGVFGEPGYSIASPDGNAVLFSGSGSMGISVSGNDRTFVARRSIGGWITTSAVPRVKEALSFLEGGIKTLIPSSDMSHVAFSSGGPYVSTSLFDDPRDSPNYYLAGPNPFAEPIWLSQPTILNPKPGLGEDIYTQELSLVGASSDLKTIYFDYPGTLIPQDAPRAPYVSPAGNHQLTADQPGSADGFYEWKDGALRSAGVLPDGSVAAFGALPAAELGGREGTGAEDIPDDFNNQVSADGSRAFFVSPDPVFCESYSCGGELPQLYVRETAADGTQSTALVSRDPLLPEVGGLPAPAPDGPLAVRQLHEERGSGTSVPKPYVYASSDGSQAFFESVDRLTGDAPNNAFPKEYDFNTVTNTLVYLPGVTDGNGGTASVLASSQDGSRFLFDSSGELGLWSNGPEGTSDGAVTKITELPSAEGGNTYINSARATPDGSAFIFATNSPLPAGFNNGNSQQVYRYGVGGNTLNCVSCPPLGSTSSGNANLSNGDMGGPPAGINGTFIGTRALSVNGDRVFFDTPNPLVSQDTDGVRDVYEWEDGSVYLISSGVSASSSFLLDNGADGNDVFFATTDGLAAGDTDGSYDVYDARVPRAGDTQPPNAVPCQADVCQGPPRVPAPLGAPASATFSGLGNPTPLRTVKPAAKKSKPGKAKSKKKTKKVKKTTRSKKAKRARKPTRKPVSRQKGEG